MTVNFIKRRPYDPHADLANKIASGRFLFGLSLMLDDLVGAVNSNPLSGTTLQRPTPDAVQVGVPYFDTTLGYPIWWTGTTWVKYDGTAA